MVALVRNGSVRPAAGGPLLVPGPDERGAERMHIAHGADGACVFRENQRCTIHRHAGHMALPVSCRHFPRVVLRDPRGTLVSLSHYCPTAASLIFQGGAVRTVPAGSSLSVQEPVEGLDARDALPPLVHPGMLADIDGYDAWERSVVETLAGASHVARALDVIRVATEDVRHWTPAQGTLTDAVHRAFAIAADRTADRRWSPTELDIIRTLNRGEVSLDTPPDLESAWDTIAPPGRLDLQRPIVHYLAARAFANWVAYQGHGLRTVVAWLRACYDVLRAAALACGASTGGTLVREDLLESIRVADLVMLHTIDSHAFARAAAAIEKPAAA